LAILAIYVGMAQNSWEGHGDVWTYGDVMGTARLSEKQ